MLIVNYSRVEAGGSDDRYQRLCIAFSGNYLPKRLISYLGFYCVVLRRRGIRDIRITWTIPTLA